MLHYIFITTLLFLNSLTALTLKDKLTQGTPGDYIITKQNQFCSLIRIHTLTSKELIIEEVSFPEKSLPKDLKLWLDSGAKGHTSWTLIKIDLSTNTLKSLFSFTKDAWLEPCTEDSFFLKILTLPLSVIPEEARRRIGPAPLEGMDTRKIWTPPLFFEGKKESSPQFIAYQCAYPKDGSPLSGKRIELFFTKKTDSFPFPHWGQVTDNSDAALKFRVIDSGQNLPSPKKHPL